MLTIDNFNIEGADTTAVIRGSAALIPAPEPGCECRHNLSRGFLPDTSVTGRMQTEAHCGENQPHINRLSMLRTRTFSLRILPWS
jgi:hypothetical protein